MEALLGVHQRDPAWQAGKILANAKKLLDDKNPMVRVRAAEFLGTTKVHDPMPTY